MRTSSSILDGVLLCASKGNIKPDTFTMRLRRSPPAHPHAQHYESYALSLSSAFEDSAWGFNSLYKGLICMSMAALHVFLVTAGVLRRPGVYGTPVRLKTAPSSPGRGLSRTPRGEGGDKGRIIITAARLRRQKTKKEKQTLAEAPVSCVDRGSLSLKGRPALYRLLSTAASEDRASHRPNGR